MNTTETRGRKDGLTTDTKVAFLTNLDGLSNRYYAGRLLDMGFIAQENIQTGKRGRPQVKYVLTGKGRGFVAICANRFKPKTETIDIPVIDPFEIMR